MESAAPTRSNAPGSGSRLSGTSATPEQERDGRDGTLTRNTDVQEKHSSRSPPNSGPRPMPIAAMPAQMPIALPRSSRGKTFEMIDSVAGMISAPPTPITARIAISWFGAVDSSTARLAPPKIAGPPGGRACGRSGRRACPWSAAGRRRRAGRSRRSTATSRPTRRSCSCRLGSATLRIVLSSPMMSQAERQDGERLPAPRVDRWIDRGGGSVHRVSQGWRCEQDWIRACQASPHVTSGGHPEPAP